MELLLKKGADINVGDCDGETPLHLAASEGHQSVVELLLEEGANLEVEVEYGGLKSTASDLAKKYGHTAVFELLQEAREQRRTLPTRNLTQSQNLVDESNNTAG